MKLSLLTILVSFLFVTSIFGQSENDSTEYKEDIEQKIPLTLRNFDNYPNQLIIKSTTDFFLPVYFGYQTDEITSNLNLDLKRINSQLLNDFKLHMRWQTKQDLGVFGEYLNYASYAAVVGLAIAHIVKYKDDAMIFK